MSHRQKIGAVVRVATGNFLEMYDFMVFGYYAAAIGRAFFPKESEFASLMLSLATFGVGFLMRPLGAIVLGAYMDRRGRRAGAPAGGGGTAAARLLGRRGAGRRVGLSFGDRHARPQGLLRELAIGQPA